MWRDLVYLVFDDMKNKKKILLIGTSNGVIDRKRPDLNKIFDEIVIMNRSIFHLESHVEYFGTPTIWANCGWDKKNSILNPSPERLSKIYDILDNSNIKNIWLNSMIGVSEIAYKIPNKIKVSSICGIKYKNFPYHSLGLQSLIWCVNNPIYDTYFLGMDSYRKSTHYYEEEFVEITPSQLRSGCNYIKENIIIQELISEGKIKRYE